MEHCKYLRPLRSRKSFSRNELFEAMSFAGSSFSEASLKAELQKLLKSAYIVRVGRNAYSIPVDGISKYQYEYSELAKNIAKIIEQQYPLISFGILEMVQLNEFMNHQLAHNVIILSIEGDLGDFVFDTLKESYPGKVLLEPTIDIFHKYWYGDMIVIRKLVTEAPKSQSCIWAAKLEKLLVDIVSDPLILNSISVSEYPNIYTDAFNKYIIDESCLFRYAKRRGSANAIMEIIENKTNIQLRTR